MTKHKKRKILAIDPGTREMGIALLENGALVHHGVKILTRRASPHDNLQEGRKLVLRLIRDFRPQVLALEKAFFANNRNAALLNVLVDEIAALGTRKGLKVLGFAPNTVKRHLCGNGRASKAGVARVVVSRYPELKVYLSQDRKWKEKHHANMFDAVALAIVCRDLLCRVRPKNGQLIGRIPEASGANSPP
jgi:crossover junction endodeoxyribonuclease RuvC